MISLNQYDHDCRSRATSGKASWPSKYWGFVDVDSTYPWSVSIRFNPFILYPRLVRGMEVCQPYNRSLFTWSQNDWLKWIRTSKPFWILTQPCKNFSRPIYQEAVGYHLLWRKTNPILIKSSPPCASWHTQPSPYLPPVVRVMLV